MIIININYILENYYSFNGYYIEDNDKYYTILINNNKFRLYKIIDTDKVEFFYSVVFDLDVFYKVIYNNKNQLITKYDNNYYVLLNIDDIFDEKRIISLFLYPLRSYISFNFDYYISRKDYYEKMYLDNLCKFDYIDESIDYYLCLFERAIWLFKLDNINYIDVGYIQYVNYDYDDYRNFLNLNINFKEIAIAKYLKYLFFSDNLKNIDLYLLFSNWYRSFEFINYNLLVGYMLYPDYYFSLVEEIIMDDGDESKIVNIVGKIDLYEMYIRKIVDVIYKIVQIKIPIII